MLPVAVDAMGGDYAPAEILKGARLAADEGVPVLLFGDPARLPAADLGDLQVSPASEVISMHEDPGHAVRSKKDASVVRAALSVKQGETSAMVSAGNTGAAMACAVLRMGRIKQVARPAIAVPIPVPDRDHPNLLLDGGANADCQPEWLLQFACMGAVHARDRFGVAAPRVGLLSIGEEPSKGNALTKKAHELMSETGWQRAVGCQFVGNVEGRDLLTAAVDVIVTDGFTGNVMLKTAEGVATQLVSLVLGALERSEVTSDSNPKLVGELAQVHHRWNPDTTGGAVLLGVNGVSIISHGSSNAEAIKSAVVLAKDLVERDTIAHLEKALAALD